jgi:expansin (peptidoglycan-binding protein)
MKPWFFLIASAALLASCASSAELAAADDSKCQSYGFALGSEGYAQCRMTMDTQRQQARASAIAGIQAGLKGVGDAYANMPVQQQRPIQCTTTALGDGMSTSTCQ